MILAAAFPNFLYAEIKGEEGTPQLPGVPWHVHDAKRPQPPHVAAVCVVVPPPADATVLFNGKNLDAWQTGDGAPTFQLKDGVMVADKKNIETKEQFGGAVQLHLEWRLPAGREVNGQKGGNSGVFFMGIYEIQILQSHNNPTYPDGTAGAIYGQYPPLVNATSVQGEWQSYDITFEPPIYQDGKFAKPARVTVIHNGVVVQNATEFHGPTMWRKLASYPTKHPQKGPIGLQFHGDPLEFRNIWIRPLGERDHQVEK